MQISFSKSEYLKKTILIQIFVDKKINSKV